MPGNRRKLGNWPMPEDWRELGNWPKSGNRRTPDDRLIRGGEADKAPFISYMKGALLHSARLRSFCRRDTPA